MRLLQKKVAVCSDIHLGLHQASDMWHGISIEFAHWLKSTLTDRGITDIIIPGDVLHDRNDISVLTLHYLPQFFKILQPFNIIITVGNHDCYYNNRSDVHSLKSLDSWENVTVIDVLTTATLFGTEIAFCPWAVDINDIPQCDIIFGHFDIQNFRITGSRLSAHGHRASDLLNKAPLVITGHYHGTQHREYSNGSVLYVGSPYEHNWGEANTPKGIYLLDIPTKSVEFIENLVSPKHKRIKLSELVEAGKLTEDVKACVKGNIVKFVIDIDVPTTAIDSLVAKFKSLSPAELNFDTDIIQKFSRDDTPLEGLGVDVQADIVQFVKTLEDVKSPGAVCEYLADIYKRAEKLVL